MSLEYVGLIVALFALVIILKNYHFRNTKPHIDELEESLYDIAEGICPNCNTKDTTAVSKDAYWFHFRCTSCGHRITAHLRDQ